MIHLTDKHIAVEIPEDACNVQISDNGCFSYKTVIDKYRSSYCITSGFNNHSLVGVTPLTEQQIHSIVGSQFNNEKKYCRCFDRLYYLHKVSPKDRWEDIQRLKRLDPNKKYAIIKIEKDK